uniref:rhombosortase n=1 Tax=Thaumasiovibrio occultus TaxID=1891184 RepID=UPI001863C4D5|nr:rhombosortase [Thaumasiovibrio occultus]
MRLSLAIVRYLVLFIAFLTLMQIPALNEWAFWRRTAIADGEWWRILTGNLTHTNSWHLLMNSLAFFLIGFIFRRHLRPLPYTALIVLISIAIGSAIWWSDINNYAGLSGTLHGLFIWGALQDIRHHDRLGWALLVGVIVKNAMEWYSGGSAVTSGLINARVAYEAHTLGLVCGALIGLLSFYWPRTTLRKQTR